MAFDRNALDSALVDLAAASTALERSSRPNLKDVEEARDRAKKDHGILDAAHKLMSVGIYVVADAPAMPGTPLPFSEAPDLDDMEIQTTCEPVTPTPAELLKSWDGWDEAQREEMFNAQLVELSGVYTKATGEVEPLDVTPWLTMWNTPDADDFNIPNKELAFEWVVYSVATGDFSLERNVDALETWYQSIKDAPEPDEFDTYTEEEREESLKLLLDKLETEGLEQGDLALKDWKKAEKTWRAAWTKDPKDTHARLTFAAYHRPRISWDIPTDEEMAMYAVGFVDPMETLGGEA